MRPAASSKWVSIDTSTISNSLVDSVANDIWKPFYYRVEIKVGLFVGQGYVETRGIAH